MNFNSCEFIIFFPVVTILYYLIPGKCRYLWLLIASYFFYMCWNPEYVLLLFLSTLVTYASGIGIEYVKKRKCGGIEVRINKAIVCLSFVCNLGILFFYKYFNFFVELINRVSARVNLSIRIQSMDILLPVGISFFTFQALSYTIDVYRGDIYAERNFFRYALYVSFFPQLVAGPIERAKSLLTQLSKAARFDFDGARDGFLLMLWGFYLKIVLADRLAVVVDTIYDGYEYYSGWYFIVAAILFSFQIYCDFSGYSAIAIGAAEILGIKLMENFDAPYISETVSDFWKRWHISLTSWFRDYLYIPLGGNRKGRLRKYFNCLIVFLISGLWHGASLHYVAWGGLNGLYQIAGDIMTPIKKKVVSALKLNEASIGFRFYRCLFTFGLVTLAWVYFRAPGIRSANNIIISMFHADNPWILVDGSLYELGLNEKNFRLMVWGIMLLIASDIAKRKRICIRTLIAGQDYIFRWLFVSLAIVLLLIVGIWGGSYDATNFIYFQF